MTSFSFPYEGTNVIVKEKETDGVLAMFNVQGLGTKKGSISGINYLGHGGYNINPQSFVLLIADALRLSTPTP
jgi:hypothetical protein